MNPRYDLFVQNLFYTTQLVHLHDIGIDTVVKDPFGKQILKQNLGDKEGVVHFRSAKDVSGLYEICFKTNTSHWFGGNQKIVRQIFIFYTL